MIVFKLSQPENTVVPTFFIPLLIFIFSILLKILSDNKLLGTESILYSSLLYLTVEGIVKSVNSLSVEKDFIVAILFTISQLIFHVPCESIISVVTLALAVIVPTTSIELKIIIAKKQDSIRFNFIDFISFKLIYGL